MIFKIPKIIEVDVAHVRIEAPVNYGDEEIPLDFPGRTKNEWEADVNLDTRKILGWPEGKKAHVHLTVKDEGTYTIYDQMDNVVVRRKNDYVPHGLIPGDYGDVIVLEIAADGTITNWPKHPHLDDFFPKD